MRNNTFFSILYFYEMYLALSEHWYFLSVNDTALKRKKLYEDEMI